MALEDIPIINKNDDKNQGKTGLISRLRNF